MITEEKALETLRKLDVVIERTAKHYYKYIELRKKVLWTFKDLWSCRSWKYSGKIKDLCEKHRTLQTLIFMLEWVLEKEHREYEYR